MPGVRRPQSQFIRSVVRHICTKLTVLSSQYLYASLQVHDSLKMISRSIEVRSYLGCRAAQSRSLRSCFHLQNTRAPRITTQAGPAQSGQTSPKVDVVALGNLCVDVVIPMDTLPEPDLEVRRALLERLTQSPSDQSNWEVGGNCNFIIAGARLGMRVASVGHIGNDVYGKFLEDVLQVRGFGSACFRHCQTRGAGQCMVHGASSGASMQACMHHPMHWAC